MKNILNVMDFGAVPGSATLQTEKFQNALNKAKELGGATVVVPKGEYVISGVLMFSDTTLLLEDGATLLGSKNKEDYPIWDVPENVTLWMDPQMIVNFYHGHVPTAKYRRAMISAYGEHDIAVIGEGTAIIDGRDCYDALGEEGLRGPHGMSFSSCANVTLKGYIIRNSANFMHQVDNCENVLMENLQILAGHDGTHFHRCRNVLLQNCVILSGDDCLSGIDMHNITVRNCFLNTACNVCRIGGVGIHIENCAIHGPGYYPHRVTVVHGENDEEPRTGGRHNTLYLVEYFSSECHPAQEPARDIVFRNCSIDGVDAFLHYEADNLEAIHAGQAMAQIALENVTFTGLRHSSVIIGDKNVPLEIDMHNVAAFFEDFDTDKQLVDPNSPNVVIKKSGLTI